MTAAGGNGGAPHEVFVRILQDLEEGRLVPGQRLVETDLAARFGVGRNAVREAMQRLAMRGVVDLSRHRSAAIRELTQEEMFEVLDVAAALTALVAGTAAARLDAAKDGPLLRAALDELDRASREGVPSRFGRARRRFYRALLLIGGNRELQRLFPSIGIHTVYLQCRQPEIQAMRLRDYQAIGDAVLAGDVERARRTALDHVERIRAVLAEARPVPR